MLLKLNLIRKAAQFIFQQNVCIKLNKLSEAGMLIGEGLLRLLGQLF